MKKVIKISKFGSFLITRAHGRSVRETEFPNGIDQQFCIDFDGVEVANHSFLDELIGKFFYQYGLDYVKNNLTFVNTGSHIDTMLMITIRQRLAMKAKEKNQQQWIPVN